MPTGNRSVARLLGERPRRRASLARPRSFTLPEMILSGVCQIAKTAAAERLNKLGRRKLLDINILEFRMKNGPHRFLEFPKPKPWSELINHLESQQDLTLTRFLLALTVGSWLDFTFLDH